MSRSYRHYQRRLESGADMRSQLEAIALRPVEAQSVRANPALPGVLFTLGAEAGLAQAAEIRRNIAAAESDELRTEGRVHVNTRSQRHE